MKNLNNSVLISLVCLFLTPGLVFAASDALSRRALDAVNDALSSTPETVPPPEATSPDASSDIYAPYLGAWAALGEAQDVETEDVITFVEENGLLLGRPDSPDLPVLRLRFENDGILRGEAVWDTERVPVTVELVGGKKKLFITFAPPESEYVHVIAVKKE